MIQQDETINEIWRSISGYINYQVSNIGRVRNIVTGKILNNNLDIHGYYHVALYNDGIVKNCIVHQLVAEEFIIKPDVNFPLFVDHIDRNRINNQISNLRFVSISQSSMNRSKRLNTSSRFKGVYYDKHNNKWRASIRLNKKFIHIGRYEDEDEAANAYNNKAIELFGEYACLNQVDDP